MGKGGFNAGMTAGMITAIKARLADFYFGFFCFYAVAAKITFYFNGHFGKSISLHRSSTDINMTIRCSDRVLSQGLCQVKNPA